MGKWSVAAGAGVYVVTLHSENPWTIVDSSTLRYFGLGVDGDPQTAENDLPFIVPLAGTILTVIAWAHQQPGSTVGTNEATALHFGVDNVYTSIGNLDLSTITPGQAVASVTVEPNAAVATGARLTARITPAASYATNANFLSFGMTFRIQED